MSHIINLVKSVLIQNFIFKVKVELHAKSTNPIALNTKIP